MKKTTVLIASLMSLNSILANRIEYGNNISVNEPVYENLYIAGVNVTINAPVYADLVIAGGTVVINDSVMNDILVVGGNVTFAGYCGGDIRCAGGKIRIGKNISGDVVLTGGTIIIDQGVNIGNLMTGSGSITINGNINGDVKGVFSDLVLNGNIGKEMDCRGGTITINGSINGRAKLAAGNIAVGDRASFSGDLYYWNRNGIIEFKPSQIKGRTVYDRSLRIHMSEWYFLGATTFTGLIFYLGTALVMILLIQYMFPVIMRKAADTVFNYALKSLVSGILFLIAAPLVIALCLITIVGIPVGILAGIAYITVLLLGLVISSVVAANWANNRLDKKWSLGRLSLISFAMFIVLKLVSMLPFAGWVIMILIYCMALGGIVRNVHLRRKVTESAA